MRVSSTMAFASAVIRLAAHQQTIASATVPVLATSLRLVAEIRLCLFGKTLPSPRSLRMSLQMITSPLAATRMTQEKDELCLSLPRSTLHPLHLLSVSKRASLRALLTREPNTEVRVYTAGKLEELGKMLTIVTR